MKNQKELYNIYTEIKKEMVKCSKKNETCLFAFFPNDELKKYLEKKGISYKTVLKPVKGLLTDDYYVKEFCEYFFIKGSEK